MYVFRLFWFSASPCSSIYFTGLLLSRWVKWEVAGMWLLQSLQPAEVNCRLNSSNLLFPLSGITTLQLQLTPTKQGYILWSGVGKFYNSGSTGICIHSEVSVNQRCHSWLVTTCEIGQYVFMKAAHGMTSGVFPVVIFLLGRVCLFGLLWWQRTAVLAMSYYP